MGHREAVVGDGDVADLALLFSLQSGVIQAVLSVGLGTEGGVVELIDVDVVSLEHAQALLQIFPHAFGGGGTGFGGDVDLVPHAGKGSAHLLLAVGVGTGGVKVVHSSVIGAMEQRNGILLGNALNGQAAKGLLLRFDSGFSQCNKSHGKSSS